MKDDKGKVAEDDVKNVTVDAATRLFNRRVPDSSWSGSSSSYRRNCSARMWGFAASNVM
jgi:hypothetical protein